MKAFKGPSGKHRSIQEEAEFIQDSQPEKAEAMLQAYLKMQLLRVSHLFSWNFNLKLQPAGRALEKYRYLIRICPKCGMIEPMELLNISAAPAMDGALVVVRPAEAQRKRPGLAWVLSVACPGAGQLYCGYHGRGITTLIVFWSAVLATFIFKPPAMQWGIALRFALALWCFATLDAFLSAREINSGIASLLEGANPRVAAILNLLTKGWGYFYLGRRAEGIGVFVLLLAFEGAVRSLHGRSFVWLSILAEIIMLALCIHAYHLGRRQLKDVLSSSTATHQPEGLSIGLPLCCAAFVATNYVLLLAIGVAVPSYKIIDQRSSSITHQHGKQVYANSKYGVSVAFPEGWQISYPLPQEFVMGVRPGGGCIVQFMATAELPIRPLSSEVKGLVNLLRPKGFVLESERPVSLGMLPAQEATFRRADEHGELEQNYAFARRGLSTYIAITSTNPNVRSKCEELSETIKNSISVR